MQEQIVDADVVKARQPDEEFVRPLLRPGFEIAVLALRDPKRVGDLLLRQIMVFP